MSDPADLTTLAAVKQWLYTNAPDAVPAATDALLSVLITACSVFVQNEINRTIASTAYTETRNGQGGSVIITKQYPILSVASVTVDGQSIQARGALTPTTTGNGAPSYAFDDISIALIGCGFTRGFQNVIFSYTAGYASTPADLDHAVVETIGDWFKYKDRIGQLSMGIEGQTISFTNADIPKRAMGVIDNYRKVA